MDALEGKDITLLFLAVQSSRANDDLIREFDLNLKAISAQ